MSGMRLTVLGVEELRARLDALPVSATKAMRQAMSKALDVVYRRVADNLTGRVLNVQSGRLRQSIQTSVEDGGLRGRVGTNVNYAEIHEYGGTTAAHRIEARRGKALAFKAPGFIGPMRFTKAGKLAKRQTAGAIMFRRAVEHPGSVMPARPYMRPALAESREEISDLLRVGLADALMGAK
jgi:HK97 gp10 family phage protein